MINNRYLLLDTSLWAQADHLTVTPGRARKASQNPLFGEDCPGKSATTTSTPM